MAKKTDFPFNLRPIVEVLNSFRGHWHDYDIFRDFLDYTVGCLLVEGDKELAERLKTHYREDYPKFRLLFLALAKTMQNNLPKEHNTTQDGLSSGIGWFDALGGLYENIASHSHCSWLGQFFTPAHVCDLMTQITHIDTKADGDPIRKITSHDPCSGSGRMLLSFNSF